MLPESPTSRKSPPRSGQTWTSPSRGCGSTARLVGRGPAAGFIFATPSASVSDASFAQQIGRGRFRSAEVGGGGNLVPIAHLVRERVLAERVVRHAIGGAAENLLAVVAREQPRLMIDRLPREVGAADLRLGEVHGIGNHRGVRQVIAVADEELDQRRLIALRQSVSPQPALLEMRRLHLERLPDETSRREAHPRVRRPRRRMRTAVHPDRAVPFERLVVPVNRDEPLRVRIALLPGARVADRADGVRRDVAVALMMTERDARGVVRQREQPCGFVDRKAAVVAELRARAPFERVFVERRGPVAGDVESRSRRVRGSGLPAPGASRTAQAASGRMRPRRSAYGAWCWIPS